MKDRNTCRKDYVAEVFGYSGRYETIGGCLFCELFVDELRENAIMRRDLIMLSLHLESDPYHLRGEP
jgi:hypothetical protein